LEADGALKEETGQQLCVNRGHVPSVQRLAEQKRCEQPEGAALRGDGREWWKSYLNGMIGWAKKTELSG